MTRNIEQKRASDRAYYKANRDRILAYHQDYDAAHKAEKKAYDREYRERPEVKAKEKKRDRREQRKEYYRRNAAQIAEKHKKWWADNKERLAAEKRAKYLRERRQMLVKAAKYRAAKQGVPFDITEADLHWPTHCPVFGIELNYATTKRGDGATPSLDKVVPDLGYVRGNVQVISLRANRLKNNATAEEILALARYVSDATK